MAAAAATVVVVGPADGHPLGRLPPAPPPGGRGQALRLEERLCILVELLAVGEGLCDLVARQRGVVEGELLAQEASRWWAGHEAVAATPWRRGRTRTATRIRKPLASSLSDEAAVAPAERLGEELRQEVRRVARQPGSSRRRDGEALMEVVRR